MMVVGTPYDDVSHGFFVVSMVSVYGNSHTELLFLLCYYDHSHSDYVFWT